MAAWLSDFSATLRSARAALIFHSASPVRSSCTSARWQPGCHSLLQGCAVPTMSHPLRVISSPAVRSSCTSGYYCVCTNIIS
eukprot:863933-Prorocentrum_minimum.AAC.2